MKPSHVAVLLSRRWVASALIFWMFCCGQIVAQTSPHQTEPKVSSRVEPPAAPPMRFVPGTEEPLVATGQVSQSETHALDNALAAFRDISAAPKPIDDFDEYARPLLSFIVAHPLSNWNASLYLNLGLGYYHAGYYGRTFGYYEKAWQLSSAVLPRQCKQS